ncbi:MAG: SGNH/GDSL hydrolase family protein [Clostridia bacterium]|nr:SGNH/GDSL hydrolase family protein [Clostridia bacterium]
MQIKTPRKTVLLRTLCILLALLILAAIPAVLTPVLMPKYLTASKEGSLTEEYYGAAAEVAHDVIFIGDCEIYESFVPAILWEEYSISSYLRGNAQQLVWHSYYMLEDTLRYETPKAVVFNVLALKYGEPQKEAYNRMALDGMEWSSVKAEAIRASMTKEEDFLTYVFPFFRSHSRWSELTAEDFRYAYSDKPTVSDSGYLIQAGIIPADPENEPSPSPLVDVNLPATAMEYLDRMTALCKEKGIELILIQAPTNSWRYHWYDEWDAQIVSYAAENGLAYYNFMDGVDAIGLDMSTDTYDAGIHLNVYGAEKLSRYFGAILRDEHGIPDQRESSHASVVWQERVETYYARKVEQEKATTNP